MKTIRKKILIPTVLLVAVSLLLVGGISSLLNYRSTFSTLEQTMTETAAIASARVEHHLSEYANIAREAGCVARLARGETPVAEKKAILDQRCTSYGFVGGGILDAGGRDIFTGNTYGNLEFYQESIAGESHMSEPLVWDATGQWTVVVSAPLWEGGIPDTQVVGVIYLLTAPSFLSDIVFSIHVSAGGAAYIIDAEGNTIAHQEMTRVESGENIFQVAKQTPALAPLSDIHTRMVAGQSGFDTYTFGGVRKFVAFAPVDGTHSWSIAVNAPIGDFMGETYASIVVVVIMLVVFVCAGVVIAYILASRISKPVVEISTAAGMLASGDFRAAITYTSRDELGGLADSMRRLGGTVVGIIQGMDGELGAMSQGDFTQEPQSADLYVGDFSTLRVSVDNIRDRLNQTLAQINLSADQVSSGSGQVAAGAQALSQGATEQASAIEELSASIAEISTQVTQTAQNARNAKMQSEGASGEVLASNDRMQEMIAAMNNINKKSGEISKIIKVIEDIAFQTNILALNAAVEAARAGEAGKGFAVVADEVRNLAGKSAEAASNTTVLIEETVHAVEQGAKIATATAHAMLDVVEGARGVTNLIVEISDAAGDQADSIGQITAGLDQIAGVVQTNSATAEESAAASEQLSSQAQLLKTLVGDLKLRESSAFPDRIASTHHTKTADF